MPATLDDITIITINRPLVAGNIGATNAEWVTLRADLDTMLARPAITALGDVPDVDTATTPPVAGDTLVYDDADSTWKPGSAAGALDEIEDNGAVVNSVPVTKLWANEGLSASEVTPGTTEMSVRFGGTGSQVIAARSDHTHTRVGHGITPYTASGNLSSGSRTLASQNVTLTIGITYLVVARLTGTVRGSGGSSYYTEQLVIDGNTSTSDVMQCVGGVPNKLQHEYAREIDGTGAAITITGKLFYDSGDPTTVDAGRLIVMTYPVR